MVIRDIQGDTRSSVLALWKGYLKAQKDLNKAGEYAEAPQYTP